MQELYCVLNIKIKTSLAPGNEEEVVKAPPRLKKKKMQKCPHLLSCRLGENSHRTALSYCGNRTPRLFLDEESTRQTLQHIWLTSARAALSCLTPGSCL